MEKQLLKDIMLDQKSIFFRKKDLINRDIALDKYLTSEQVVVISGVRRCGKSSLLKLIKDKLELEEHQLCYFNFDDERITADISIFDLIYTSHLELYNHEPVFFFDEVQVIPGWQKFVNRMHEQGSKVYVTGSNARLLSSEIATSLTGRIRTIKLFPFSFAEYLRYIGHEYNPNRLSVQKRAQLQADLLKYLYHGGFPLVIKEGDIDIMNDWFQDIIYRDIIARYNLASVEEIRQMAVYLLTNIGKIFSYSTLQEITGLKSSKSVKDFLFYFETAFLFTYLKKFDYSVRKQIMNSRKVYAIDNAVVKRIGINFSPNIGRLMENVVFIELQRRQKEVFYFQGKYECDFLLVEGLKVTQAIQVTYNLNAENFEREKNGLLEAIEKYAIPRGIIITFDDVYGITIDKVEIVSLSRWLLTTG